DAAPADIDAHQSQRTAPGPVNRRLRLPMERCFRQQRRRLRSGLMSFAQTRRQHAVATAAYAQSMRAAAGSCEPTEPGKRACSLDPHVLHHRSLGALHVHGNGAGVSTDIEINSEQYLVEGNIWLPVKGL